MAPTATPPSLALGISTATNFIFPYTGSSQAVSMPRFRELAPELREMVWRFAIPPPQVITITRERCFRGLGRPTTSIRAKPRAAYHKIPAMLHTCRESRDIALERYTESFGERLEEPIYFDVERDKIFVVDPWTLEKFYGRKSRLPGESQDIEDAVQHMVIATSNVVDLGTIKCLTKFNLVTLQLETCGDHHYSKFNADDRHFFAWDRVKEILVEDWEKAAERWGRDPTTITYLTRQQMFDSSDIGQEYTARKAAYNRKFCAAVRETLPSASDDMVHHIATDLFPPIFNGMKIYRLVGYYDQEARIDMFLKYNLSDPGYCKICASFCKWEWDAEAVDAEESDSKD